MSKRGSGSSARTSGFATLKGEKAAIQSAEDNRKILNEALNDQIQFANAAKNKYGEARVNDMVDRMQRAKSVINSTSSANDLSNLFHPQNLTYGANGPNSKKASPEQIKMLALNSIMNAGKKDPNRTYMSELEKKLAKIFKK